MRQSSMLALAKARKDAAGRPINEDRRWLTVMAATAVAEFFWWAAAHIAGLAPYPSLLTYVALTFAGLAAAVATRKATRPGARRCSRQSVISGAVLVAVGGSLFLPLKFAIPGQVSFWLDAPLAAAERGLFGTDPWLLLDRVLGWAVVPMDWLYVLWLPTQLVILFTVMLEPPGAAKSRALMAYSLAWFLLGVAAATLFSSAGPIFFDRLYGGGDYAPLREMLQDRGAWVVLEESDAMWSAYVRGQRGQLTGISALPSIHVAISFWIYLVARSLAPRLAKWGFIYFCLIWLGSVQLGWHYVSDGLAGTIGMFLIWVFAGAIHGVLDRSDKRSCAAEADCPAGT